MYVILELGDFGILWGLLTDALHVRIFERLRLFLTLTSKHET